MCPNNKIKEAVRVLKRGGIIAYPTDTLFGIGCDATNIDAVSRLFKLKKRDKKPMSIACSSVEMIEEYAEMDKKEREIIKKYLPGPYTILLNKKQTVSNLVTAGSSKIGVRIPNYPQILKIISVLKKPIISTSANLAGEPDIESLDQLKIDVDFVVEGECKYKQSSTIVDIGERKILRQGARAEEMRELLSNL